MIIRVLNEGQFRLTDDHLLELNACDDKVEQAVDAEDQAALTAALNSLIETIRRLGQELPDDSLEDSDLIVPDEEATLDDVKGWLEDSGSSEGLIPGRADA
ncbi:PspA-associated protein PspAA [Enemella evansiae]|uniref:PspA-associated protein PspAA n=1 Tax=Enemella evansiae TaxID=2016499 RepID=UPI000B961165|nr:hypothetical protein [Enemella evansiae]OYO03991.1 hypothetical protein CGZ97_11425 [Enemella evansiae]